MTPGGAIAPADILYYIPVSRTQTVAHKVREQTARAASLLYRYSAPGVDGVTA